jgi:hypothetical protein
MNKLPPTDLVKYVSLAVESPSVSWTLFSYGTFVIKDPAILADEQKINALKIITKHGQIIAGESSGDFSVTELQNIEGWLVSASVYGLFTYVHPSEMKNVNISDLEVGLFGRMKRNLDGIEMEIIHVH